jgi:hypothetical protein
MRDAAVNLRAEPEQRGRIDGRRQARNRRAGRDV